MGFFALVLCVCSALELIKMCFVLSNIVLPFLSEQMVNEVLKNKRSIEGKYPPSLLFPRVCELIYQLPTVSVSFFSTDD